MNDTHSKLTPDELGTIEAILQSFDRYQIPQILKIKEDVDRGEVLGEFEMTLLQEAIKDVQVWEHIADRHSEYKKLIAEIASLYSYITQKALDNQKLNLG